ncbi:phytanoyl-CoA dioxygenase family protein [Streptomyces canus]|uniref:phytanoyl-CoA dioxygenase family protein n=1 Tax=Streptomyces canus TaxID=58343 RepID=UPI003679DB35
MDETLRIGSVEELLTPDELNEIRAGVLSIMKERRQEFSVTSRPRSVHRIDGETLQTAKDVYEPAGRIEFDELPKDLEDIAKAAVQRRLRDIRTLFPSARRSMDWFYVEYGTGQFITPHVDYPNNELDPARPKIAAVSLLLESAAEGGDFFVETFASHRLWSEQGAITRGADFHSEEFRNTPKTRWRCQVNPGDAVLSGTQMVHGTEPVVRGVAGKLIGFLGT